jgi:hypothetical protein
MVASFALIAPFFFLGNPSGHDFEFHMYSWMEVLNQWKQGILYPRWAALSHWTYGEARFLFYPPVSWSLGAILGAVLPWKAAPGAFVWLALSAAGLSMFRLARRWLSRSDAIAASVFYAANPYHIVIVYWRSALAELLASCLLPLLLLLILKSVDRGNRMVLPLGLVMAAAWLTNVPSAVMVNYSLALLVVVVAIAHRAPRLLCYGAFAVVLGAALAAFYLVPAAYEEKWINVDQVLSPGVRPEDNFLFTSIPDADHNNFNRIVSTIGVSEITVLAGALVLSRRWRRDDQAAWWSLAVWGIAAGVLMFPFTLLFWQYLPKLRYLQFPWRWLLCLNVPLAVLLAVAWHRWIQRVALYVLLLGVIALVGQRMQPPWWDNAADINEMQDAIADATGYEGTDEYVPDGVDPSNLNKDAPLVAAEPGSKLQITSWKPESRTFIAEVTRPEELRLRLFNYPAWGVEVNHRPVHAETSGITGEMLIPVETGRNEVTVTFERTWDRTLGGVVSLVSALGLVLWGAFQRRGRVLSKTRY